MLPPSSNQPPPSSNLPPREEDEGGGFLDRLRGAEGSSTLAKLRHRVFTTEVGLIAGTLFFVFLIAMLWSWEIAFILLILLTLITAYIIDSGDDFLWRTGPRAASSRSS